MTSGHKQPHTLREDLQIMAQPSNQRYSMTCANDAGETRTVVRTTACVTTDDMPDIYEQMYDTLRARGFDVWLHDSAIAWAADYMVLPTGVKAPVLIDLLDAVAFRCRPMGDDTVVATDSLKRLMTYLYMLAGKVQAPDLTNPQDPLSDETIAAILSTGTDKDVTVALNALLAAPPLPPAIRTPQEIAESLDEVDWATPDDVMDLLAGQPDLSPYEGDDI